MKLTSGDERDWQKRGVVYLITNTLNGKLYVGQTIQSLRTRIHSHVHHARGKMLIGKAIEKYGESAFTVEILLESDSLEVLNTAESRLIAELGTLVPSGYNLRSGGSNDRLHETTRRSISRANCVPKAFTSPEGFPLSVVWLPEFCADRGLLYASMIKLHSGAIVSHRGWQAYPQLSQESRETRARKRHEVSGCVVSPLGEIRRFDSIKPFCLTHGLNPSAIGKVLRGDMQHHAGWTRFSPKEDT